MKRFRLANETQRDMALTWLRAVPLREPLELMVQKAGSKRSVEQNRRLHALIAEIAEQTPWSTEAWKEYLARQFLATEELTMPDGEIITRRRSTASLDVVECTEFMQRIEVYAATELQISIAA